MTETPKRIWAYAGSFKMWRDHKKDQPHTQTEYHRADLSADLVRAALYETRGLTWSGVEALIADPEAVAAIVAQVMEKEHD